MMRSRFFYAIPSLLLALVAVGIALYGLMLEREASTSERPEMSERAQNQSDGLVETRFTYLIAQQAGDPGSPLVPDGLVRFETTTELQGAVPSDEVSFDEPLKRTLRAGEIVTFDLYKHSTRLQPLLEDGMRAMALELTPLTSIGGLLQPGDYIDIYSSFRGTSDEDPAAVETLSQLKVLAVQGSVEIDGEQSGDNQRRNQTIVLAVPRQQVPRLALASAESRLSFVATGPQVQPAENDLASSEVGAAPADEMPAEPLVAYLTDIKPAKVEPSEDQQPPTQQRSKPSEASAGREVRIFEGSSARSIYVQ
ncbi:MAG: Flp pilus assembly protein CpaB [Alteromonadaceae bacterium]|nr:Flp pilus assembly protein CpaB [Alteromonadaceae bacterium]